MRSDLRTVGFAVVFGTACALILTAAGRLAAPYREANERAEEARSYLAALGVPIPAGLSADALVESFDRSVRVSTNGAVALYAYVPDGAPEAAAFAVPVSGMGLWGPIHGVLALEPDLVTIRGLRFYRQEETPGLGGDIGSERFAAQFRGKRIVSDAGEPGFRLVRAGEAAGSNAVDAITGATMTSERVQTILCHAAENVAAERSGRHGRGE